jgi:predicted nucleic acid-binding protein
VTRLEVGYSAWAGTDLGVGATAGLGGLTVLHCDKDFDLIASVTGWVASAVYLLAHRY